MTNNTDPHKPGSGLSRLPWTDSHPCKTCWCYLYREEATLGEQEPWELPGKICKAMADLRKEEEISF